MQKQLTVALFSLCSILVNCIPDGTIEVREKESETETIRQISAGGSNFCYIAGNKLKCRGYNYAGTETLPFDDPDEVAVGQNISCFRKKEKVRCWNSDGLTQRTPVATGATNIAVAGNHTCAILSGQVRCWGEGSVRTSPQHRDEATEIALSRRSGCAIVGRGVTCWGYRGSYPYDRPEFRNPTNLTVNDHTACIIDNGRLLCWGKYRTGLANMPRLQNAIDVAAGREHICAINRENERNKIVCWGQNKTGAASPPDDIVNPIALTAGDYFSCALSGDGNETCWGDNSFGQSATRSVVPQPVSVAVGRDHACSIDDENSIACWGNNDKAQLMFPQLGDVSGITAFSNRTCAISEGRPKCWGKDSHKINLVPATDKAIILAVNDFQGCAITEDSDGSRELECVGTANGTPPPEVSRPEQLVAGKGHHCVLDSGEIKCWGNNGYGQIAVPGLTNPQQVATTEKYSCAIDEGRVVCWGTQSGNRLHYITEPEQIALTNTDVCAVTKNGLTCVPVAAKPFSYSDTYYQEGYPELQNPTAVFASRDGFCGIDDFGVTCWGLDWGRFKFTPAEPFEEVNRLPRDLINPRQITVTHDSMCAVDDNGIECWGRGTANSRIAPEGTDIEMIKTAANGSCGIVSGKLKCWGKAGILSFEHLPKPTSFAIGSYGIYWRGYENNVCAIFDGKLFCWSADVLDKCQARTSELSNPRLVAIGQTQTCAADDHGVSCWDSGSCKRIIVPAAVRYSTEVSQLESGSLNCAMVAGKVICWKERDQSLRFVPDLSNPTRISVNRSNICALDDTGAVCWQDTPPTDDPQPHIFWDIPALVNPTYITAGPRFCAIDQTGIVCWAGVGGSGYNELPLPNVIFAD